MAGMGAALDDKTYLRQLLDSGILFWNNSPRPFSKVIPMVLWWSIRFHPAPDLMELAVELYEKDPAYAPAGILAALLSKSAEEAFELSGLCETADPRSRLLHNRPKTQPLLDALHTLVWDKEYGRAVYRFVVFDPAKKRTVQLTRPIAEPLDRRWYKALLTFVGTGNTAMERKLAQLIPLDDQELCRQFGSYLE